MGIIKQGILGGFRGKVGSVVGGAWKGIATMRAMPLTVANPRTPSQVNNRDRNTAILALAQAVSVSFIRTYWNRLAKTMSGFNMFMSVNKNVYNPTTLAYDWANVIVSNGTITPPVVSAVTQTEHGYVDVEFSYPLTDSTRLSSDVVGIVVVNGARLTGNAVDNVPSTAGAWTVGVPVGTEIGDILYVYVVSRRADGTLTSYTTGNQVFVVV